MGTVQILKKNMYTKPTTGNRLSIQFESLRAPSCSTFFLSHIGSAGTDVPWQISECQSPTHCWILFGVASNTWKGGYYIYFGYYSTAS